MDRLKFRKSLPAAKLWQATREGSKSAVIRALDSARRTVNEPARRAAARHGLDDPRGIYMLDQSELRAYLADPHPFAATIAERARAYEALAERRCRWTRRIRSASRFHSRAGSEAVGIRPVRGVDRHQSNPERRRDPHRRRDPDGAEMSGIGPEKTREIAERVERFVREVVAPYERDPRRDHNDCPTEALVVELREKARSAGVLTPHILPDRSHLSQRETAIVRAKSGLSPLGPLACNTAAPDEGNMYLPGRVGSPEIKERFLKPVVEGRARSAFFMTEPAEEGGAGSDPSMMITTCRPDGNHWVVNGRKAFITGAEGAKVGIVMAKAEEGACMFVVDFPDPAIRIERVPNAIDSSMPGGHAVVTIDNLRIPANQMLGQAGEASPINALWERVTT
jgi:hypothetical protein